MNDDVNAELYGALKVRRHERVIAHDARARRVRNVRDRLQVRHHHHRVSWRLDEDHLRILFDCNLDVLNVCRVNEAELYAVVREHAAEEPERAAVRVVADYDVLARLYELERRVNRGHSTRKGVTEARALQSRDVALDGEPRRVLSARVLESLVLAEALLRVG